MLLKGHVIGQELLPLQLGVGTKGGSENAGRLAKLMLDADPSMAVINLDTNPRKLMWQGVCPSCPSLCRWFQWAYGSPTELGNTRRLSAKRRLSISLRSASDTAPRPSRCLIRIPMNPLPLASTADSFVPTFPRLRQFRALSAVAG
eukprot:gene13623-9756_t